MSAEVIAFKSKDQVPLEEVLNDLIDDVREGRAQSVGVVWRRTSKTPEETLLCDTFIENFWLARSVHELVGLLENFKLEIIESRKVRI